MNECTYSCVYVCDHLHGSIVCMSCMSGGLHSNMEKCSITLGGKELATQEHSPCLPPPNLSVVLAFFVKPSSPLHDPIVFDQACLACNSALQS